VSPSLLNDFFLKTEKEKEDSQKAAEEVGSKKKQQS